MKILLLFLALSGVSHAVTYWGNTCTNQPIMGGTCSWNTVASGASCSATAGTNLVWPPAPGDTLNLNGCTNINLNVNPGSAGHITLTNAAAGAGVAGGSLACATATGPATINADLIGGSIVLLATAGTAGPGCNITGNIVGGGGASAHAVSDTHANVTLTVAGNITGGAGNGSNGYIFNSASGAVSVTGNVTGGAGLNSFGLQMALGGSMTLNGNCIGSDVTVTSPACVTVQNTSGTFTITGNLIFGLKAAATTGNVFYTPAASNYILMPRNASYVTGMIDGNATEMPTNPGVTNVRNGVVFGSFTGTLSAIAACTGGWR